MKESTGELLLEPVIGLEIHIHLLTRRKVFAPEGFAFGAQPNSYVSAVTLAHPGALPLTNLACVQQAIRLGLAIGCEINTRCFFDRKNYFYPDLPKGYQLTQDYAPICREGLVQAPLQDGTLQDFRIQRIHIEEDAGKLVHDLSDHHSLVDLNRAGVGLVEMVTHPDIHSPEAAGALLAEVRRLVRYLGVSDGNMEEGSLRCDANISLRPVGETRLGVRTEVKNINSISFVVKALQYEIARQTAALRRGETLQRETRTWDAAREVTLPMRDKESADDYRYFPEPDLLPLHIETSYLETVSAGLPRLPAARFQDYHQTLGLPVNEALTLAEDPAFSDFFEGMRPHTDAPRAAALWMLGPLRNYLHTSGTAIEDIPFSPQHLLELIHLVRNGEVNPQAAKDQLLPAMMAAPHTTARTLAQQLDLMSGTQGADLGVVMDEIMRLHPEELARFKAGKKGVESFFVGQMMRHFKGKANPQEISRIVTEKLRA
ncbi:MAG: Asp-tRNA(Asn)/Glu-tRNA(Gln) amidotransferase subunit GatB [Bacteroidia bacterium]|nr:Asp-tRNA(Asn)/Glu-tRNA(Gln) amidotransferase subunit GatB [Bacteroidia bacterium]